jgi:putative transposase
VRRPRVRGMAARLVSRVLPRFTRRTREVGALWPTLYRPGLALGDVDLALRGLLGEAAPVSPTSRARLQAPWPLEDETWKRRRLDDLAVVYVWAEGRSVQAGREATTAALLAMIGARTTGQEIVLAVARGPRASTESWGAGLRARQARGLPPWPCPMADGHLGLWAA